MDLAKKLHDAGDDARLNQLSRIWAGLLLVLLVATWQLWVGASDYPAVPMLSVPEDLQQRLSVTCLTIVFVGCCGVVLFSRRGRWMWLLVSIGLSVSFVVDQHRLQPWAYQAAISGIAFALLHDRDVRRWMIWLLASVYVYSALGKLDFQFVHTVGQDFLRPVLSVVGLENRIDESWKVNLAFGLPGLELVGGLGVLFHRTRRAAGSILLAMHVGLLVLLSPLGFHHSYGVLLWNLLLMIVAWELFVRQAISTPQLPLQRHCLSTRFARLVVCIAIAAPLAERSGYWDHWPSWALYSPHSSRVKLQVHSSEIDSLPHELIRELPANRGWVDIDLEAWSLASRGVPIYPQARYQLALAVALAEHHQLDDAVRCVVQSVSNRWNGRREESMVMGTAEMRSALESYWLVPRNQ